jgi:UDP-N-acetylglucosamine--N-acetylmuramyl-(pentapeptide) pyrophosphoryl-undecaprenol N-acetylglucosamine transferase
LSPERLSRDIGELLSSPDKLSRAAGAAKSLGKPDAVERLADLLEELLGHG